MPESCSDYGKKLDDTAYYMIDRSHGGPALQKFFTREFQGTQVSDFWSPYDSALCTDQQECWLHLLLDMASADVIRSDDPN